MDWLVGNSGEFTRALAPENGAGNPPPEFRRQGKMEDSLLLRTYPSNHSEEDQK